MPSAAEHLGQAKHNETFLSTLDLSSTPFLDWAVTIAFYAAVHYIRCLAAQEGFASVHTYDQETFLFSALKPLKLRGDLYNDYRQLKDDSRSSRYDCWHPKTKEVEDLRDGELKRIRDFVVSQVK